MASMKGPRGVQQEEVSAAADALLAEQIKPSIERVRQKLGRGSPNTVGPMLEVWFMALGERLKGVNNDQSTAQVPPEVQGAMTAMWQLALAQAHDSLQAEREALLNSLQAQTAQLDQQLQAIEVERATFTQKFEFLSASLEQNKSQLQALNEQMAQMQASLNKKDIELAQARQALEQQIEHNQHEQRRNNEQALGYADKLSQQQQRFDSTERRLLLDVDRERQTARKALADWAAIQERVRADKAKFDELAQSLGQRIQDQAIEVSVTKERLETALGLNEALQKQLIALRREERARKPLRAGVLKPFQARRNALG